MISYNPFWKMLKEKGLTQYKLREHYDVNSRILAKMRKNQNLNIFTIGGFCKLLNCKIEDIVEYVPDEE